MYSPTFQEQFLAEVEQADPVVAAVQQVHQQQVVVGDGDRGLGEVLARDVHEADPRPLQLRVGRGELRPVLGVDVEPLEVAGQRLDNVELVGGGGGADYPGLGVPVYLLTDVVTSVPCLTV